MRQVLSAYDDSQRFLGQIFFAKFICLKRLCFRLVKRFFKNFYFFENKEVEFKKFLYLTKMIYLFICKHEPFITQLNPWPA